MRILFLTQLLPYPLTAGPKVRAYYVLRYLAQRHAVTLLTFTRPDDPPEAVAHLREFCAEVHTVPMRRSRLRDAVSLAASLLDGQSFVIRRDYVRKMAAKVDALLATGGFDAVHADQLWMAQYALRAKRAARPPMRVLDEHNACYLIFQRLARGERNRVKRALLRQEWRALARYEARACGAFDRVVTVTDEDRWALDDQIGRLGPPGSARVPPFATIPICVDPGAATPVTPNPDARDVLHMGTMFFLPNVEGVLWFAREVWPRVAAEAPDATFTVVGKNPPPAVLRLAGEQRGIRVTGYVADPDPCLRGAAAFVVPLHSAGGMRVKILDAWSWGLPVVSTAIGAEGICCVDGEDILLAEDAESFARAVVRVLRDPELARRLRINGRRAVEERYDWRKVYCAWDGVYAEA
jgi:glycosyltransferase involved in cell wall biosynthesis